MSGSRRLARWLLEAEWRSQRGRAIVAVMTIALGVALGYAVQLINSAAFNEFSAAARSLSGQADLQVSCDRRYCADGKDLGGDIGKGRRGQHR